MKRLFFVLTFALVSPTISAKSQAFIQERAREITELLVRRGAEILVVACNTAPAVARQLLKVMDREGIFHGPVSDPDKTGPASSDPQSADLTLLSSGPSCALCDAARLL